MTFLGQLVVCEEETRLVEPICVFLGWVNKQAIRAHIFGKTKDGWESLETFRDLNFVRVTDKNSPTGQSIYSGPFVKKTLYTHFKIKPPTGAAIEKEIEKLKKLCKN